MRCAALTGIAPEVIKDIKAGRPRTIELQSTHNIVTMATVEPGPETHIFMTSIDLEDLGPGDAGICAYVLSSHHLDEADRGVLAWQLLRGT